MICGGASGPYNVPTYSVLIIVVCANAEEVSSIIPIDVITLSILCIVITYPFFVEMSWQVLHSNPVHISGIAPLGHRMAIAA